MLKIFLQKNQSWFRNTIFNLIMTRSSHCFPMVTACFLPFTMCIGNNTINHISFRWLINRARY